MKLTSVTLAGFAVLSCALAFKMHELGQELTNELQAAALQVNEAERINRGLVERVHALGLPPFSIHGFEATSAKEVGIERVESLVLYLFGVNCTFSPRNVPFLNKLHAAGVNVVGIAPGERRPAINMFGRSWQTTFPLFYEPTGSAVDILPRGQVPLTALFLNGRLEKLWLGPLAADRQQLIVTQLGVDIEVDETQ